MRGLLVFVLLVGAGYVGWRAYRQEIPIPAWMGTNGVQRITQFFESNHFRGSQTATNPVRYPVHETPAVGIGTNSNGISRLATNETILRPQRDLAPKRVWRPVRSVLDAQIALARIGISVGCIDGAFGNNMRRALLAWQIHNNLPVSGELDAETKAAIQVEEPLFTHYTVRSEDLERLMKVPATWLGKSEADRLDYETILEMVAEKGRATESFIRALNPEIINWRNIAVGTAVKLPRVDPPAIRERAAFVRVHLYSKQLDVFGSRSNLIAHYPCSIAAKVEKRPIGRMEVAKAAANPSYLFNPEIFSESPEARRINRKLTIPPGPNNPVGTAWIGLSKPGYGIHGTPKPEQVGRTESHGCFRLANWNAEHLLQLSWAGMPVYVEP